MLPRIALAAALAGLLTGQADAQLHDRRAPFHRNAGSSVGRMRLPAPDHGWRGAPLSTRRWNGGHWYHGLHNGRMGWWWAVGPDWFFYNAPVYPFPDIYGPPGAGTGWWWWCDVRHDYYPYVTTCPSGWRRIYPR